MKFEIFDLEQAKWVDLDWTIEFNPFLLEENQELMARLEKLGQSPKSKFYLLNSKMSLLQKTLEQDIAFSEKSLMEQQDLRNQIIELQAPIFRALQPVDELKQEVVSLEKEYDTLVISANKTDEVIRSAFALLIRGKKYKASLLMNQINIEFIDSDYSKKVWQFKKEREVFVQNWARIRQAITTATDIFERFRPVLSNEIPIESAFPEFFGNQQSSVEHEEKLVNVDFGVATDVFANEIKPYSHQNIIEFFKELEEETASQSVEELPEENVEILQEAKTFYDNLAKEEIELTKEVEAVKESVSDNLFPTIQAVSPASLIKKNKYKKRFGTLQK
ncbi:MAG: hypothetical protein LBI13_03985 [Streptococcaceae bacterium]|jgi:hypothetical protein|nr:hypothetical protein [Streptococcaceae bacterium]